jgi:hypothetical protein
MPTCWRLLAHAVDEIESPLNWIEVKRLAKLPLNLSAPKGGSPLLDETARAVMWLRLSSGGR